MYKNNVRYLVNSVDEDDGRLGIWTFEKVVCKIDQ